MGGSFILMLIRELTMLRRIVDTLTTSDIDDMIYQLSITLQTLKNERKRR